MFARIRKSVTSCYQQVGECLAPKSHDTVDLNKPYRYTNEDGVYPPAPENLQRLKVKHADVRIADNGRLHRTERYELMMREERPQLVVRRGQPFTLVVTLDRNFYPQRDAVSFIFKVADQPKASLNMGTQAIAPLLITAVESNIGEIWTATVVKSVENTLTIKITPAATCIIGEWLMEIDTKLVSDKEGESFKHPDSIYILFNPWCTKDQVYMKDEDKKHEYVLSDSGLIWRGTYNNMRKTPWKYGQFEKDILECALSLFTQVSPVKVPFRNDVIMISRCLSAAINSPDDNGVLTGNWSAEFEGGTNPSKWTGSLKILQKYYSTKKSVKYGQCWVFSGVLTTVCRALGIPARTVTTYNCAHDTHGSLTIDKYIDENGTRMDELDDDSIWNFHVWNELWMRRPDLAPGSYEGWNAVDGTPQELSEGIYQCGPAPVKAVKSGDMGKQFDCVFVFAEVNADVVYWKYNGPSQPLKLLRTDKTWVGQMISTKAVGKWERQDITHEYKYPEKSNMERVTMEKALRLCQNMLSRYYLNEEFNMVKFDFKLCDDILIGSPFSVELVVQNTSRTEDFTIVVSLNVVTVTYTGKTSDNIKKENFEKVVKRNSVEKLKMNVTYEEYKSHLVDQSSFNISCFARISNTEYEYFATDDFRIKKPDIKFKIEGTPTEEHEFTAKAMFVNPLPVSLTDGKFLFEGPALNERVKVKLDKPVPPSGEASAVFTMKPVFPGKTSIVASFVSNELDDVHDFVAFMVQEKKPI